MKELEKEAEEYADIIDRKYPQYHVLSSTQFPKLSALTDYPVPLQSSPCSKNSIF